MEITIILLFIALCMGGRFFHGIVLYKLQQLSVACTLATTVIGKNFIESHIMYIQVQ